MPPSHVQEHIDVIVRHEQEFLAQRTHTERVGDNIAAFVGSLRFVSIHLVAIAFWILWNLSPHFHHFDPLPFSLLGTILGIEAIFIAAFILMRQARVSRRADQRDHLMLQVLLLTEKEITAMLQMNRQIAKQLGLASIANTIEVRELSENTSIEDVAQSINDNLSASAE